MTRRGWLLFTAMGVIWGIPYLLIKVAVGELSPASLVLLRTGIGALLLVPIAAGRGQLPLLTGRWRWLLLYTVVELAVPWLLLSYAERRLSSSLSGLLVAAVPFVGALVALVIGGDERIDRRRAGGLLLGFGGVGALVGLDLSHGDALSFGEVIVVTVGYAVGPMIIARRLATLPPMAVVAVSLALTAIVYTPIGIVQLPRHLPSISVVLSVIVLGVLCTALAFLVFFELITEVGPIRATVITYINPAVALVLGVLVLGEPVTTGAAVGFPLILLGSYLATRRSSSPAAGRRRRPRPHREPLSADPPVAAGPPNPTKCNSWSNDTEDGGLIGWGWREAAGV